MSTNTFICPACNLLNFRNKENAYRKSVRLKPPNIDNLITYISEITICSGVDCNQVTIVAYIKTGGLKQTKDDKVLFQTVVRQ